MAMRFNSASFFVLAVCLTAISLFGKITGDLQVRVADATDAVVPNACKPRCSIFSTTRLSACPKSAFRLHPPSATTAAPIRIRDALRSLDV